MGAAMKTGLIQIATLFCLSLCAGFAGAAQEAAPPRTELVAVPAAAQQPVPDRDTLAWQRVGAPASLDS